MMSLTPCCTMCMCTYTNLNTQHISVYRFPSYIVNLSMYVLYTSSDGLNALGHGRGVSPVPRPRAWCRLCSWAQGVVSPLFLYTGRACCRLRSCAKGVVSALFLGPGRGVAYVPVHRACCRLRSWTKGVVSALFLGPGRGNTSVPGPKASCLLCSWATWLTPAGACQFNFCTRTV